MGALFLSGHRDDWQAERRQREKQGREPEALGSSHRLKSPSWNESARVGGNRPASALVQGMSRMKRGFVTTALCLGMYSSAFAQVPAEYRVPRAPEPPKLDGILDESLQRE